MKILALDTSNQTMSIALLEDEKMLASYTTSVHRNHSVTLMPAIEYLMVKNNVKPKELDRIVVAKGPGSYTGLRIGVTTAKTLAWTLGIELTAVSSLAHLASSVSEKETMIVPVFDARRGNVYTGVYRWEENKLCSVVEDQHTHFGRWLEQLAQLFDGEAIVFVGELSASLKEQIYSQPTEKYTIDENFLLNSVNLGRLGLEELPVAHLESFVPTYLKLAEAEEKWLSTNPKQRNHYVEKI
ncbi:tRNA (adenosine(37)-N6)-threonylcarbamoyltransferase complex dimerization subunit type 1 TsaB [Vagococcus elongatus]|uniref:tRNA (Adenosine(37)-N6)-threonylcarbamoyltransferase complex dimerization subunit type 1 TsaB n=1 Tax=Vagococcus elongatus TaxID=180344 RepID=A0A430B1Y7_9ENTE|nr:tRNA (adenosine(37)-N6)-threonylcarbamoyltransferase complex dimerization subunit type 1 TsaB [Vagococcus elongatus]RSU14345.1 tRNA (adenosine(37)-N6)-threonylcarbamoyltransferase complex dimerization subunit type 1 TsaB [Vagococcus elongatus]